MIMALSVREYAWHSDSLSQGSKRAYFKAQCRPSAAYSAAVPASLDRRLHRLPLRTSAVILRKQLSKPAAITWQAAPTHAEMALGHVPRRQS